MAWAAFFIDREQRKNLKEKTLFIIGSTFLLNGVVSWHGLFKLAIF